MDQIRLQSRCFCRLCGWDIYTEYSLSSTLLYKSASNALEAVRARLVQGRELVSFYYAEL